MKFKKKLSLNKETIARLQTEQLRRIEGGLAEADGSNTSDTNGSTQTVTGTKTALVDDGGGDTTTTPTTGGSCCQQSCNAATYSCMSCKKCK